jgi:ATP-dependent RNA helicase DDX10/DBP4
LQFDPCQRHKRARRRLRDPPARATDRQTTTITTTVAMAPPPSAVGAAGAAAKPPAPPSLSKAERRKRQREEERRREREQLRERKRTHRKLNSRAHREQEEIAELERAVRERAPAPGVDPLSLPPASSDGPPATFASARTFDDLPLSQATRDGLRASGYVTLTAIQRAALPHALCGRDVLGAAKTGSGKTLAFVVPLLEALYRARWTRLDGLGGLVLTPTRELAMQIFEELKKAGRKHDLSAGLLIGGRAVGEESARVAQLSVLVATPGRLLQHMDETPGFDASGLKVLVLDEADRCLDMGFSATLDAILANLPPPRRLQQNTKTRFGGEGDDDDENDNDDGAKKKSPRTTFTYDLPGRQTLLFSATQTRSVRDLARLQLSQPEYLSAHAAAPSATPLRLQQAFCVLPADDKVDVLWSFVRSHLRARTIVFLSTCKQVRFLYEAFRRLRPGVPLRALHGGMKQQKRAAVFSEFGDSKGGGVLLATDVAARGLDFPSVDWVVQVDAPEDAAAYLHRVGRTARYMASGRALLLLAPSEREGALAALAAANVPIRQTRHNPQKVQRIGPALQALLSKSPELKAFAQRALAAYLRSVFLQPDKRTFDVTALPVEGLAASLGLPAAPRLRFLKKTGTSGGGKSGKVGGGAGSKDDEEEESEEEEEEEEPEAREGKQWGGRQKQEQKEEESASEEEEEEEEDGGDDGSSSDEEDDDHDAKRPAVPATNATDDDDFLVVAKRDVFDTQQQQLPDAAAAAAMARVAAAAAGADGKQPRKKKMRIKPGAETAAQRTVFDDEGRAMDPLERLARSGDLGQAAGGDEGEGAKAAGVRVEAETADERFALTAALLKRRDVEDKARLAAMRKQQRREKRARQRAAAEEEGDSGSDSEEGGGGRGAVLASRRPRRTSSDGDDSGGSPPPPEPPRADPAYIGMARVGGGAGSKPAAASGAALAAIEDEALRVISKRRAVL